MKNLLFIFLAGLFIFSSCKDLDNSLLIGKWKGDQLLQNGKDLGAKQVEFNFFDNGTYSYQMSYIKEAGNYHTVEDKLYTTDTLQDARLEKVVRVSFLSADSMYLDMNAQGVPQILKCYKSN